MHSDDNATLHLRTRARHWFWMQEAGPQLRWPGGQLGWAGDSARRHMAGMQVSRLGQCSCTVDRVDIMYHRSVCPLTKPGLQMSPGPVSTALAWAMVMTRLVASVTSALDTI